MARGNQKNRDAAIRFRTIAWTFAACAVVAMVGLGLAHQHNLHHDLADEGRRLDREIDALEDRIRQAIKVEAALKSPLALEQRVRDLNLGLVPIQATQRLFLARSETPAASPALPLPRISPGVEVAATPETAAPQASANRPGPKAVPAPLVAATVQSRLVATTRR